ncbi:hypothetical protein [Streptomyces blastmyceticus]|uniref:Aminoglycoside phosphotransferase domain-containing protein n=1 Tax=Streptomyces blastmyceticus TaxID=68180 RepID=A0ABN0X1X0_9ACTN
MGSEEELAFLRGDALLHTDINPDNLTVEEVGSWIIDWAWPTCGPAFIDPACFVVQLIAAGHSSESAESWAAGCTAWANADAKVIDVFAGVYLRMLRAIANRCPDEGWLMAMAEAAQAWADHRGIHKTAL